MIQLHANRLLSMGRLISHLEGGQAILDGLASGMTTDQGEVRIVQSNSGDPEMREHVRKALEVCEEVLPGLDLPVTEKHFFRVKARFESGTTPPGGLIRELGEIATRATDELKASVCFRLRPGRHDYFTSTNPFGEEVATLFSAASYDIKEASLCVAVERWTAVVLHLMRASEVGLRSLGDELGVKLDDRSQWKYAIDQIEKAVREYEDREHKPGNWRRLREQYAQDAQQLFIFKEAWRNHAAHIRQTYDEVSAMRIYDAVRAFFQRMAERQPT